MAQDLDQALADGIAVDPQFRRAPSDDPYTEALPEYAPSGLVPTGGYVEPEPIPDMDEVLGEGLYGRFQPSDWASEDPMEHDANLARFIDQRQRDKLAQRVCTWVDRDRQSRKDWEEREALGMVALGVTDEALRRLRREGPNVKWASTAVHPGLAKAIIQFWSRSYAELWPAGRPAKAVVVGKSTDERQAQARRVAGFLNYLYAERIPAAAQEMSQLLFRLPLSGSVFKAILYDPLLDTVRTDYVECEDLIKPYSAVELSCAPRYTRLVRLSRNDVHKLEKLGYYLWIQRSQPESEATDDTLIDKVKDSASGIRPAQDEGENEPEYDSRDVLYETRVYLDLADYEWEDPLGDGFENDNGDYVGIGLPYLVTVDKQEQRTVAIRRDWRETDKLKARRDSVIEYKFYPGFGGYGFGLLHVAGSISDSQSGLLRYTHDGCALDTLGRLSGYVSQSAVGIRGLPPLKLGEFQEVPGTADDWSKQIWSPNFQWRANNNLELMQYLDGLLEAISASTEAMVGDEARDIPVGTILARIEQVMAPFKAIFGLLHQSLHRELRAVAQVVSDNLGDAYPYPVDGADEWALKTDFNDRVDVLPVSDPNAVSGTQRRAEAQVLLDEAKEMWGRNPTPEVWDVYLQAWEQMLSVLRIPEPGRFVPQPPAPQPEAGPEEAPEETRKDTATAADIRRKDAAAAADIKRKDTMAGQQMETNSQLRGAGTQAIVANENAADTSAVERRVLDLANARRAQLDAQAAGGAQAVGALP